MATKDKLINLEDLKVLSDHVEGEVTDLKSDLSDYLPTELYDSADNTAGKYYIASNGGLGNSAQWNITKKFTLSADKTYLYDGLTSFGSANVAACYYGENDTFISSFKPTTGENVLVIPSGAVSVGFSVYSTDVSTFSFKEKYSARLSIEEIETKLSADIDEVGNEVDAITKTKSAETPITEYETVNNYYLSPSGAEAGPFDTWGYIKFSVSSGETYSVTTKAGASARHWLVLNSNNSVIQAADNAGSTAVQLTLSVTVPENGAYLVVNFKTDGALEVNKIANELVIDEGKIYVEDEKLDSFLNGIIDQITNEHGDDILYGKKLCCVGDSITYGDDMDSDGFDAVSAVDFYQWQGDYHAQYDGSWVQQTTNVRKTWNYIIAKRHNMTLYNGGVNGSTMQGLDNKYGFSLANGRYTKLPDDIDYLLIWFGWNDTTYGTLGAITDTTNESYYGGYNVVLPYLINKYPYTKIGLIVPYGTDENHRNAIRLLGNKWGVAVWDNYQGGTPLYYGKEDSVGVESSIITSNRAKFQANGAHPNHFGHEQLAAMIEEFLMGI